MRAQQNNTTDGASALDDVKPDNSAQRVLLNRTLATWAWNKSLEDGQAEVAKHLGDIYAAEAFESLTPKQIGNKQGMQRLLLLRNFALIAAARFFRLNPRADSRLAVLIFLVFFADIGDDGLARLAFRKMEKIFGRSRQSLGEGIADLEKAGLLMAKRANGGQSTSQLNIPRILDEVQPHLTWIADALSGQADLTGQVELTGQAELTTAVKSTRPDRSSVLDHISPHYSFTSNGADAPDLDVDASPNGAHRPNGTRPPSAAHLQPNGTQQPISLDGDGAQVARRGRRPEAAARQPDPSRGSRLNKDWQPSAGPALIYVGGDDFELIRRPDLTRRECQALALSIESDRGAQAFCFDDAEGPVRRPGRGALRLAPHICGFGHCTPTDGPGNSLLPVWDPP